MAGGLLDGHAVFGGIGACVEAGHMAGDAVAVGELAYESLVAVAVARPQVEVAVGHLEGDGGLVEEVDHGHGVAAAANGEQHTRPLGEEVLPGHVTLEPCKHRQGLFDDEFTHLALTVDDDTVIVDAGGEVVHV